MKKIASYFIMLLLGLSLVQAQNIAITQIVEHPALDAAYKGILDALSEAGYTAEKGLNVSHKSAQGNPAIAAQIAKKFVGDKPDVIVAISTPSAQAMIATTKTIPIVFSAISDPIEAKLMKDISKPDANVTGAMDSPPMKEQIELIQELIPDLKTVGVVYNPGEPNSVSMVKNFMKIAKEKNIKVVEGAAIKTSDVTTATRRFVGKVQAIYVPLDNTVVSAFESAAKVANEAEIPLFAADTGSVPRGAVASIGFDYYQLGKQTGNLVVSILKGTKIADLPAENVQKLDLVINLKAAKAQGIVIPEAVLKRAKEILPE